jgi:hypothetical protein
MLRKGSLPALFIIISLFAVHSASATTDPNVERGFNTLQEPFSEFMNSVTQVDVSSTSTASSSYVFPSTEDATQGWEQANDWVKEKTGLDIWGVLKVIGNMLIFIMNIAIQSITFSVHILQWLVSLIPSTNN